MRTLLLTLTTCLLALPAQAKYSGGSGEPNDPYQIATAADLIALGGTPPDYGKHFILTADIDLDPNLPGRRVFDKAVIAPDTDPNDRYHWFQGTSFTGVFNGNGRTISNLTITGTDYLGLFGYLESGAEVKNLGLGDSSITGSGSLVGGLVGSNDGCTLTQCYSTGLVSGNRYVGGLIGYNNSGTVTQCHSIGAVRGTSNVGGLVGYNAYRAVTQCYSIGAISGAACVGGLIGYNYYGTVTHCYSTGAVSGGPSVGGLVGGNYCEGYYHYGTVTHCYSTGAVRGASDVGGLVGSGSPAGVTHSVWDRETSGLSRSEGGLGLTTVEMMDPYMLGLNGFANDPNWVLDAGRDYPRLAWEGTQGAIIPEPDIDWLKGEGTAQDPYRINAADQLVLLGRASALCDRHFVLDADIDLDPNLPDGQVFADALIPSFTGILDANGHTISHLAIKGVSYLGIFGHLRSGAEVKNLGVVDVNVVGSGADVGGLVGVNSGGGLTNCYCTGAVSGTWNVGGLVGCNSGYYGTVTRCHSSATVSGDENVGGLVGENFDASVTASCSTGAVSGNEYVGGLVGLHNAEAGAVVTRCYSTGRVNPHFSQVRG